MIIYVDTNVILSFYDKTRPHHKEIRAIFRQDDLTFLTGFLTVVEFESVFGRLWANHQVALEGIGPADSLLGLPLDQQVKAVVEICFGRLPVTIVPTSSLEKMLFNTRELVLESTLRTAYVLAPQVLLRTLDALQLASAVKIKHYTRFDVTHFLTGDANILNFGPEIRKVTKILAISPHDFASVLKIA